MNSTASPAPTRGGATRAHACVLCQQRKVKCSRETPCSACIKSRVECVYRDPAPPRRRKRRTPEDILLAKLKRYEELLENAGIKVDAVGGASGGAGDGAGDDEHFEDYDSRRNSEVDNASHSAQDEYAARQTPLSGGLLSERNGKRPAPQGRFVAEEGRSRYLENNMWTNLTDELRSIPLPEEETVEMPPQAELYRTRPEDNDLIIGTPTKVSLTALHPNPTQVSRLWDIFLTNINPLTHLIHTPSMQQSISDACAVRMQGIPRGMEAFLFAMYLSAVNSATEGECLTMLGESKEGLMMKFWFGSRQSLINSLWLRSSELMVLQAFVVFLLSVRQMYDPRTLWSLTGIALRIGQRIGLHRDGASLGLAALETELRRRLWWQILVLDGRMAELSGSGFSVLASLSDTKLPLNVNDIDLQPGVMEPPAEHSGATEMMFCLLRYEFGRFFKGSMLGPRGPTSAFDGVWQALTTSEISVAERNQTIDELQEILESKFLRFCDPLNPLHFLSGALARSALATMRFKVHHPRGRGGQTIPAEELNMLFTSSLRIIEYDNLGHSTQSVQRFLWHIKSHFAWDPFIYLLTELRRRTTGSEVERAWQQVDEAYQHHGEFLTMRSPLHDSVAVLAERAWDIRETELARRQGISQASVMAPNFITVLRSRRSTSAPQPGTYNTPESYQLMEHSADAQQVPRFTNDGPNSEFPSPPVELSPIDWGAWDTMIQEFELNAGGSLY